MTDELYKLGTGYIQDGTVVLAEDAMLKVRAWDAMVNGGHVREASYYEHWACTYALWAREVSDAQLAQEHAQSANAHRELADVLRAIEGA